MRGEIAMGKGRQRRGNWVREMGRGEMGKGRGEGQWGGGVGARRGRISQMECLAGHRL